MLFVALLLTSFSFVAHASLEREFDPGFSEFSVSFRQKSVRFREFAFFVMPRENIDIAIGPGDEAHDYQLQIAGGTLSRKSDAQWLWVAPSKPGLHRMDISRADGAAMRLNIFVMRSAQEVRNGVLNGYRIGDYPATPLRGNPVYLAPAGFIEVTADMVDVRVSPHFTLGQFLCKQQPQHWPKYLVLRERLPFHLEQILQEVNRQNIHTNSLHIMSGYRTPWYNASIGNSPYSRHIWGGAADIFIDNSGNGRMDDLTGDGRSTLEDARLLQDIVEGLSEQPQYRRFPGGLGLYGPRSHRGPFVHVDVRGHPARWELP